MSLKSFDYSQFALFLPFSENFLSFLFHLTSFFSSLQYPQLIISTLFIILDIIVHKNLHLYSVSSRFVADNIMGGMLFGLSQFFAHFSLKYISFPFRIVLSSTKLLVGFIILLPRYLISFIGCYLFPLSLSHSHACYNCA